MSNDNPFAPMAESINRFAKSMEKFQAHTSVTGLVRNELIAQDTKWGDQDHPVLPPSTSWLTQADYYVESQRWQRKNEAREEKGVLAWDGILLEEVYEALSETDPDKQEVELVQVAAVALQMVLSLRRKKLAAMRAAAQKQTDELVARANAAKQTIADLTPDVQKAEVAKSAPLPLNEVAKDLLASPESSLKAVETVGVRWGSCGNPYCTLCNR